jgi:hypothetical protein
MTNIPKIFDDIRPISALWYEKGDDGYQAGVGDCAKIVAYQENGQCDYVPFYAIINEKGDIIQRIPAHFVVVHYY